VIQPGSLEETAPALVGVDRRGREHGPHQKLAHETERWLTAGGPDDAPLLMAAGVAEHAAPWPVLFGNAPAERRYVLLGANIHGEAWLIWWPPGGRLELHDHGGASGAFWVVEGLLDEVAVEREGAALRTARVASGAGVEFGPDYVHSVVNRGSRGATSVHVYSRAGAALNFYRFDPQVGRVRTRTETRRAGSPP
jgi:hypothetical protein